VRTSEEWFTERAEFRQQAIDRYLVDGSESSYFDYDTVQGKRRLYEPVAAFWPLWAGRASEGRCWKLMSACPPLLTCPDALIPDALHLGSNSLSRIGVFGG